MKCPSCGAEASGNFCSTCGSALKGDRCGSCGARLAPGSKFCINCGKAQPGVGKGRRTGGKGAHGAGPEVPAGAGAAEGNSTLAWWVAGAMLVVVMVVLGYPILSGRSGPGAAGPGAAPAGMTGGTGASAVDLTQMPLEEQGNILFNRVMSANSVGDTADVAFFLPKALVVYEQLAPTDSDGIYHYALLYLTGGFLQEALAKAQEGLTATPDYLLLLAVSAEASAGLGDEDGAREHYRHFLEVYDTEMALMRPGYEHHQSIFPVYHQEALDFMGEG